MDSFEPKPPKRDTLPDLFRNIKKEQEQKDKDINSLDRKSHLQSLGGFITAKRLQECKTLKLEHGQTNVRTPISEVKGTDEEHPKTTATNEGCVETDEAVMEEKNKGDKLKMLFGDESDGEGSKEEKRDGEKIKRRHDERKEHKHAKRKRESHEEDRTSRTNGESSSAVAQKRRPKLKKSEIGTLVVKLLTPAYAERRFDSRDTFKSMARTISHALLDKGATFLLRGFFFTLFVVDEGEIKKYVEDFLKNHSEITSRTTI